MTAASPDEALARMLVESSYLQRRPEVDPPFRLASGRTSHFYFECQLTTMRADAMPLVGAAVLRRLGPAVRCVGGLTRGADPIAQAVAFRSAVEGHRRVDAFSVRKAAKEHGTGRWIEGVAPAGATVAVVDDVITSGMSAMAALDRCREEGLVVAQVIALVDRQEGGLEAIRRHAGPGVEVDAVFTKAQLDLAWQSLRADAAAGGPAGA